MFYLTLLFWLCHIGAAFCSLSTSWSSPACISQIQVVPSSNEDSVFRTQRSPDYSQQVGNASLKGRTLPGCHSSSNSSKNGEYFSVLPLEMQMRKPQRKKSHTLSDMRSTLVNRRSAFKSTETEVPTAQFPEMVAPLRTPRQGRQWDQEVQYEEDSQWIKSPRRQSPRHRSNSNRAKGEKNKGKGKHKAGQLPAHQPMAPDAAVHTGPPAVMPTYQEAPG